MKNLKMTKSINKTPFYFLFLFLINGCDNYTNFQESYVTLKYFLFKRWWNYDIFIHDINYSKSTQLTKKNG